LIRAVHSAAPSVFRRFAEQRMAEEAMARSDRMRAPRCQLTHDPKLDDPALVAALSSPAFYIGALGSTRTHAKRVHG